MVQTDITEKFQSNALAPSIVGLSRDISVKPPIGLNRVSLNIPNHLNA